MKLTSIDLGKILAWVIVIFLWAAGFMDGQLCLLFFLLQLEFKLTLR